MKRIRSYATNGYMQTVGEPMGTAATHDRELFAIYLVIKHFRHMIEARIFTIYTDHKSITFAFQSRNPECSPRLM